MNKDPIRHASFLLHWRTLDLENVAVFVVNFLDFIRLCITDAPVECKCWTDLGAFVRGDGLDVTLLWRRTDMLEFIFNVIHDFFFFFFFFTRAHLGKRRVLEERYTIKRNC